jgi:hypothetical protein
LNWTRSTEVLTATACFADSVLDASLKSLDMVRLLTIVSLAAMVIVALPAVPYVPPPGLLAPDAWLATSTTALALEPADRSEVPHLLVHSAGMSHQRP